MGRDLSAINGSTSDFVEVLANTTGIFTEIFRVVPDRGQYVEVSNRVTTGNERGVPVYMRLKDSNSDLLPPDTEVVVGYKQPGDEQFDHVSTKLSNIQSYNVTDFGNQQSEERIDNFKIDLDGSALQVRDVDEMAILIKSDTQLDPDNSLIAVEGNAVTVGDLSR